MNTNAKSVVRPLIIWREHYPTVQKSVRNAEQKIL